MKKVVFEGRLHNFSDTDLKRLAKKIGAEQLAKCSDENRTDVYYSDKHNVVMVYDPNDSPYYHRVILYGGLASQIEEVEKEILKAKDEIVFDEEGHRLTSY